MTRLWLAGLGLVLSFVIVGCEKKAENSTVLDSSAANPMAPEGKSMVPPSPPAEGEKAPAAETPALETPAAPAAEAPAEPAAPAAEAPSAEAPAETPAGDGSGN